MRHEQLKSVEKGDLPDDVVPSEAPNLDSSLTEHYDVELDTIVSFRAEKVDKDYIYGNMELRWKVNETSGLFYNKYPAPVTDLTDNERYWTTVRYVKIAKSEIPEIPINQHTF